MGPTAWVVASLAVVAGLGRIIWTRGYLRFRGPRLVTCPENHEPAVVEVEARSLAAAALLGQRILHLEKCSRWPTHAGCGQTCLSQIGIAPGACLVRNIVGDWYREKTCARCGRPFGNIDWTGHRPALLRDDGSTMEWIELTFEELPAALTTHGPVCWNCHIGDTLQPLSLEHAIEAPAAHAPARPPERGVPFARGHRDD